MFTKVTERDITEFNRQSARKAQRSYKLFHDLRSKDLTWHGWFELGMADYTRTAQIIDAVEIVGLTRQQYTDNKRIELKEIQNSLIEKETNHWKSIAAPFEKGRIAGALIHIQTTIDFFDEIFGLPLDEEHTPKNGYAEFVHIHKYEYENPKMVALTLKLLS